MNPMEEQLWNYIDGFCNEEEQKAVKLLIETDQNYRSKYAELMAFQKNMEAVDLEEPAMGFTFKVMENIRAEHARKPLKTSIDRRIVLGIAAFFICSIVLLLGYIFMDINWSQPTAAIKLPEIQLSVITNFLNPVVLKGFLFCDLVLALFFLDRYFRSLFFEKK